MVMEAKNGKTVWDAEIINMRVFLSTWTEDNQGRTMTKTGYRNRLLSYFFLKDVKKDFAAAYVTDGLIGEEEDENKD